MVDNTTLGPGGGGDTIATDDIAGVKYQIVKLAYGALDTATLVSAANPVPVTVANASLAVTGTFFQATQPVSGTVTANAGTGTLAVSLAVNTPVIATGGNVIGSLTANQSVNYTQIAGVAVLAGNGITGTGSQRVTIASDNTAFAVNIAAAQTIAVTQATAANLNMTANPIALTKGTQGATGFSTQDLKDAGRVLFSAATVIAGVTAVIVEALVSMVPTRVGVAAAANTTFAVTSGKTLRLTGINIGFVSTAAATVSMRLVLRMNPTGAVTATSPILHIFTVDSGSSLAQAGGWANISMPDGMEFTGAHQIGISQVASAITATVWVSLVGFEY